MQAIREKGDRRPLLKQVVPSVTCFSYRAPLKTEVERATDTKEIRYNHKKEEKREKQCRIGKEDFLILRIKKRQLPGLKTH